MTRVLKVMVLGFILIIAILILKYKPVYEVKIASEDLGYISNEVEFENKITELKENLGSIQEENIDDVSLAEEPKYELKLISRAKNTDEEKILEYIKNNDIVTTYKFYEISLNGVKNSYVDTFEEAENVVEEIKKEYSESDLKLDLAISEKYTTNKAEVKTDTVEVAENSAEEKIELLLEEKAKKEAIATINGINLSVLPVTGRVSSRYGEVSSLRSGAHTGLDIACAKGTSIKVVAEGTVTFAGWHSSYGNLVKIDHGNGIETWYAHCSKLLVKQGEHVTLGKTIAEVGSTGNSTGNHLHLEIRINGVAVNPQNYLYK